MAGRICRIRPEAAGGLQALYISVFDCNPAGLEYRLVERWRGLARARRADGTHARAAAVVLVHTNGDAIRMVSEPGEYEEGALIAATREVLGRGFGARIAAVYSGAPPYAQVGEAD